MGPYSPYLSATSLVQQPNIQTGVDLYGGTPKKKNKSQFSVNSMGDSGFFGHNGPTMGDWGGNNQINTLSPSSTGLTMGDAGMGSTITTLAPRNVAMDIAPSMDSLKSTTQALPSTAPDGKTAPGKDGAGMSAGSIVGGVGGMLGSVGGMASDAIFAGKRQDDYTNIYGAEWHDWETDKKQGQVNDAISGAMTGMQAGAAFGPIGMAAGLVVGGVGNWLLNKKGHEDKAKEGLDQYNRSTSYGRNMNKKDRYAQEFAALSAQKGMKMSLANRLTGQPTDFVVIKRGSQVMKDGGKMGKDTNVIPSGKLHKENNNLGKKDKGIPVVNSAGKKLFEIEKEELITRLSVTKRIENSVAGYNESGDGTVLLELGKFLTKELLNNTSDLSEKHLENEA